MKPAKTVADVHRQWKRASADPAELQKLMLIWTRARMPAAFDQWGGPLIMATGDDGVTRIGHAGEIIYKFRMDDLRTPERDVVTVLYELLKKEAAFTLSVYTLLEAEAGKAKGRSKGGKKTAEKRRSTAADADAALTKTELEVRTKYPDRSHTAVAQTVASRHHRGREALRKKLRRKPPE